MSARTTASKGEFTHRKGEFTNRKGEVTNGKGDSPHRKGEVTHWKGEFTNAKGEFTHRLFLAVVVILLLATCKPTNPERSQPATPEPAPDPHFLTTLPPDLRAILEHPTSLHLYSITHSLAMPGDEYESLRGRSPQVEKYPILAEMAGEPATAAELAKLFLNRDNYLKPGESWTCLFEPGSVAQISSGEKKLNVVICLKCGEVVMRRADGAGGVVTETQGLSKAGLRRLKEILRKTWATPIYNVGGEVKAPVAVYRPKLDSSPCKLNGKRLSGIPIAEVVVDATGTVAEAQTVKGIEPCIDRQFLASVRAWTFRPGTRNGKPVATRMSFTLHLYYR